MDIHERALQLLEIVDIETYSPKGISDAVLGDDWRIVSGWWATLKDTGKFKYTEKQILDLTGKILQEILKRGKMEFHPETWTPHAKELYLMVFEALKSQGLEIPDNVNKLLEGIIQEEKEVIDYDPTDWDIELMTKETNEELLGRLININEIFKSRGSSPQDEEIINIYILLRNEMDKRGINVVSDDIKELDDLANQLQEGIRPAFGSSGGKKYLAKTICSYIPDHKVYVEPFIGGGAVLFCKKPSEKEAINDLDKEISGAYKYIQAGKFDGLNKYRKDGDREYFNKIKASAPKTLEEQFYKFIYTLHFSFGGGRTNFAPSKIIVSGRTSTLEPRFEHLPKVTERIKDVSIYNEDFRKLLKEYDSKDTFFYLDPPYPEQQGKLKTDLTNQDLADAVKNLKGKWLMSLPDTPNARKVFEQYHIESIEVRRTLNMATSHKDTELFISNYPLKQTTTWLSEGYLDGFILDTKDQIDEIGPIILSPNYVSWSGSTLYAKDRVPNDADIIIKDKEFPYHYSLKLTRLLQKLIGETPCMHVNPSGPNWRYFPLYHLALIPVKDAQFIDVGKEEPGVAEILYEQIPRAASPEVKKQAEESLQQDRLKMFRFFNGMKPTRAAEPNHRMTIDFFVSLFKPEDYKTGILTSKKYDGLRSLIFRDGNKIEVWSEDGENITARLPKTVDALSKINGDDYIIDAELELWKDGKHVPREGAAGYIHEKGEPDDSGIVANIFTVLYHSGEDLHKKPEIERQKSLEKFGIPQATWSIPQTALHINRVPNLIAHTPAELKKQTEFVSKQIASEGCVAKKADSIYYLDGHSKDGWIKFHNNALIYGTVLERNETKTEGVYNYDYGILPAEFKIADKNMVEVKGIKYAKVGSTFNTDEKHEPGDLIAVECETFNWINNQKEGFTEISAWVPRYIYIDKTLEAVPKISDSINEVIEKSRKNRVLQEKTITPKGETIYESYHPTWETIDDCADVKEHKQLTEVLSVLEGEIQEPYSEEERYETKPLKNTKFKEFLAEGKKPLDQYPKNYAILVNHFRGQSVHLDFRRKQNGWLEGETIANEPAGLITEEVDTLEKGRKWNQVLLKDGKFRPDMDPNQKVVMFPKSKQPLEWINVREVVVEPGTVGATSEGPGVFITMDEGMAFPGAQRPYFREFFLDMGHFKQKRIVERLIGVSQEWDKPPKGATQWQCWITDDEVPYILSMRQRKNKRDYVPKDGEMAIPPWWEDKIKPEFKWWSEKAMGAEFSDSEKMKRLDMAFNDLIEQGILKHTPIEIKEDSIQESKAKFTLRFHWWQGQDVVRKMPATDSRFELLIDSGKDSLDRWDFSGEFYGDPTKQSETPATFKQLNIQTPDREDFRKWMGFAGEVPAKSTDKRLGGVPFGNPNRELPIFYDIKDTGNVEIIEDSDLFKSFKFEGKLLKGYYVLRREDLKSDIWIFSKGMLPGEKLTPESFFEADSTGMSEFSNSIDLSKGSFPIQIQYRDATYTLVETKNDKLILNKK